MQDSTSGRRSQGTRKEILPHRAWRFSEHPAGKQVTLYAAKSFTSRCRRIVHSRPKNKAATLFKPEAQETQLRWTADMTPEGPTVPILRRREKQCLTIQRRIQEATGEQSQGTPRVRNPQARAPGHFDRTSVRSWTESSGQERLGIAEHASPAVLPPPLVVRRVDALGEPLPHQAVRNAGGLAFGVLLPCL